MRILVHRQFSLGDRVPIEIADLRHNAVTVRMRIPQPCTAAIDRTVRRCVSRRRRRGRWRSFTGDLLNALTARARVCLRFGEGRAQRPRDTLDALARAIRRCRSSATCKDTYRQPHRPPRQQPRHRSQLRPHDVAQRIAVDVARAAVRRAARRTTSARRVVRSISPCENATPHPQARHAHHRHQERAHRQRRQDHGRRPFDPRWPHRRRGADHRFGRRSRNRCPRCVPDTRHD